tara:strand:- start:197 stop:376 length:180 start_codon:yes stop_codon:yes gene_type:complete
MTTDWNDIESLKKIEVHESFKFFPPEDKEELRRIIGIRIRELERENDIRETTKTTETED